MRRGLFVIQSGVFHAVHRQGDGARLRGPRARPCARTRSRPDAANPAISTGIGDRHRDQVARPGRLGHPLGTHAGRPADERDGRSQGADPRDAGPGARRRAAHHRRHQPAAHHELPDPSHRQLVLHARAGRHPRARHGRRRADQRSVLRLRAVEPRADGEHREGRGGARRKRVDVGQLCHGRRRQHHHPQAGAHHLRNERRRRQLRHLARRRFRRCRPVGRRQGQGQLQRLGNLGVQPDPAGLWADVRADVVRRAERPGGGLFRSGSDPEREPAGQCLQREPGAGGRRC